MIVTGRPPTRCRNGLVSSPHYLASMAGVRVLLDGGNAVDAAVAANAVLTVVYPHMCSLGGDAFWLIYSARDTRLYALNGSGRAPSAARLEWFHDRELREMPRRGILSVTVPGAVDSWAEALQAHGTRELGSLLDSAIEYAGQGFPVSAKLAAWTEQSEPLLRENPTAAAVFLPHGRSPRAGEILAQPALARSFEALVQEGRDAFYRGSLAREIVATSQSLGGLLDEEDFANHRSDWVEPVATVYRGHHVYEFPPPTQGVVALEIFNVAEGYDLAEYGPHSADTIHLLVEATRLAYRDRDLFLTDPDYSDVPTERLISKEYAASQRRRINSLRAGSPTPIPTREQGDTVYLSVVDRWGNAVSLIQSICMVFGSGVVADGTGIVLQNRGASFSLDPDHPNCIAPRKRTFHTLIPGMAWKDDRPWLVFGTMGGEGQAQTHVQVLTNIIDFGMDVQQAIEAPRWLFGRFLLEEPPGILSIEARFPERIISELMARGHQVRRLAPWAEVMGHAQVICIDPESGVLAGAADPRGDGAAIGW